MCQGTGAKVGVLWLAGFHWVKLLSLLLSGFQKPPGRMTVGTVLSAEGYSAEKRSFGAVQGSEKGLRH